MGNEQKNEQIRSRLIALNNSGNRLNWEKLTSELRDFVGDNIVETIISFLHDSDAQVRGGAVLALGIIADERAIDALIAVLTHDSDMRVTSQASTSLALIGKSAVKPLVEILDQSEDEFARFHAVSALGIIADDSTFDSLVTALNDNYDLVRKYAVYGLARFRDTRAVEPLIKLLFDKDGYRNEVADAAAGTLAEIGDLRAAGPIFDAMVAEIIWTPLTMKALGEPAIQLLLASLSDKDARRRSCAASSLGEIGEVRAVEQLLAMLGNDPSKDVRERAAMALAQLADSRATEALNRFVALPDTEAYVRHYIGQVFRPRGNDSDAS